MSGWFSRYLTGFSILWQWFRYRAQHIMTVVQVQSSAYYDSGSGTELSISWQWFRYRAQHIVTVVQVQSSAYHDRGSGTELSKLWQGFRYRAQHIMTVVQVQSSLWQWFRYRAHYDSGSGTELRSGRFFRYRAHYIVQFFRYGTQNVRTVVYVERDRPRPVRAWRFRFHW